MGSLRVLAIAGAAAFLALPAANAADLPPMMPRAIPVMDDFSSGWYLRGDIGMSSQEVKKIDNALFATATQFEFLDEGGFDSAPFVGFGIGYQLNSWLRSMSPANIAARQLSRLDRFSLQCRDWNSEFQLSPPASPNGSGSSMLTSTSVRWGGLSPFVGAGFGFTQNRISHFRDVNVSTGGVAFADAATKTNFAWAFHAGVGYRVTPNVSIELAYRYINLGDAESGDLIAFDGTNAVNNPMLFKDITSHDLKLGVRWMLDAPPPPPPPLSRKG